MSDDTIMRYDLEQPSHHMGNASMQPDPGFGGWIKYDDHAARIEALTAERDEWRRRFETVQSKQSYAYIGKNGISVQARDLEDERDALAEKLARAVEVRQIIDDVVKEGHDNLGEMVAYFLTAVGPARATLAAIKEGGE